MRVLARHGHLAFYESYAGEISKFMEFYETELVRDGAFYTFPLLKNAPKFSIQGLPYLGLPATKTFEGEPWDVLRENEFVYNIGKGILAPKSSIVNTFSLDRSDYFYSSDGPLIQPGSWLEGQQILSFDASYVEDFVELRISEIDYE
jgi:hypothetical protein